MVKEVRPDYGFRRTDSGDTTRLEPTRSGAARSLAFMDNGIVYFVFFLFSAVVGGCQGGNANSVAVGTASTLMFFAACVFLLWLYRRVFRRASPVIEITPSAVTVGGARYRLDDATDWQYWNPQDGIVRSFNSGIEVLQHNLKVAASWQVGFIYGQDRIAVATGLSETQAVALLREIMDVFATHGRV